MRQATVHIDGNVRARITGDFDTKVLDDLFSFHKGKFWFMSRAARMGLWDGKVHLFDKASGTFPLGLLPLVKDELTKQEVECTVLDSRPRPLEASRCPAALGGGVTLRPDQIRAAEACIKAERGILHGATAVGKTEVAAVIIKSLGTPPTLFLTGRKKLARQTRERLALRLGLTVGDVGFIGGGKWEHGPSGVYVAIVAGLVSKKWPELRKILYDHVELLIVDECHKAPSDQYYKTIQYCKARYRFGLTGTPIGRSDGQDMKLVAATGPVVARISATSLIEQGILARPSVVYTTIEKPFLGHCSTWSEVYSQGVVANEFRNKIIASYARELATAGKRTLILIRELDHGKFIQQAVELAGSRAAYVSGQTEDYLTDRAVELFRSGKILTLIASSIFDEGIDIPEIEALILAGGGKSPITTLQRIGRGMRKKTTGENRVIVLDFMDLTCNYLKEHSYRRKEICESEGFETKVLNKYCSLAELGVL